MSVSNQIAPEIALVIELLDLVELDLGVFRSDRDGSGDPPVSSGQTGGQVGPTSRRSQLLGAARPRNDFAVRGFP